MKPQIIPILALHEMQAGADFLRKIFDFEIISQSEALIELALNDQRIDIAAHDEPAGQFVPHHLALSVVNVEISLSQALSRGAHLSKEMTPNGIVEIKEFWDFGIRYAFIEGPENALIELCEKIGSDHTKSGHDHIGLLCEDIDLELQKLAEYKPNSLASYELSDETGITKVRFERYGQSVCELFQPPHPNPTPANQAWRGCRFL